VIRPHNTIRARCVHHWLATNQYARPSRLWPQKANKRHCRPASPRRGRFSSCGRGAALLRPCHTRDSAEGSALRTSPSCEKATPPSASLLTRERGGAPAPFLHHDRV